MIAIRTLEDVTTEQILDTFNKAFSDYIIPLRLTIDQLEQKINSDRIRLAYSVGAFEDDELIGFILHGNDTMDNLQVVYNAGTGVIPGKRGRHLTARMYEYILPRLIKDGINKIVLEVISTNVKAIHIYQTTGFNITRTYHGYKGSVALNSTKDGSELRHLQAYDWIRLRSFWDILPSWQNSVQAVEKLISSNISIGVYNHGTIVGYLIYNPDLKRIHQLAVDRKYRRMGVATQLVTYICNHYSKDISIINIDTSSTETVGFFTTCGMRLFVKQYEMEWCLM